MHARQRGTTKRGVRHVAVEALRTAEEEEELRGDSVQRHSVRAQRAGTSLCAHRTFTKGRSISSRST